MAQQISSPEPSPGHSDDPGLSFAVHSTGLTRTYPGGAGVFDVGLAVPRGCVYGLVGPNGAGKTTLVNLIAGLRRPDHGSVGLRVPPGKVAVVTDVPEFEPWLTVAETVELAGRLVDPGLPYQRVKAALHRAGLNEVLNRRVATLSRGTLQRLGLACALVAGPELIVLDEPTSALDPRGRAEILDLVADLRGKCTVLFSSHILADVQRVCDHVGVMRTGRLIYQGPVAELVRTHMKPTWLVRVREGSPALLRALAAEEWVARVTSVRPGLLRVQARTMEEGERLIHGVIDRSGARVVSVAPEESDLENAFLSITGAVR
jgi:ABC-2 type transport system ATP-binding protein